MDDNTKLIAEAKTWIEKTTWLPASIDLMQRLVAALESVPPHTQAERLWRYRAINPVPYVDDEGEEQDGDVFVVVGNEPKRAMEGYFIEYRDMTGWLPFTPALTPRGDTQ